ncbi:MAG: addiction module protein [Verrucomicrobiota bacterium]
MITEKIPAVSQLSVDEKWMLANELWDEVEEHQEGLSTAPGIIALVQQRFEEYQRDPSTAMTLEDFKRRFSLP